MGSVIIALIYIFINKNKNTKRLQTNAKNDRESVTDGTFPYITRELVPIQSSRFMCAQKLTKWPA